MSARLDYTEAEVRALLAAAAGAGPQQLLEDCQAALELRLPLAACARLQGVIEIWRRTCDANSDE